MKTCKQLAAEWEYWNIPLCSVQGRKAQRSNKGGKMLANSGGCKETGRWKSYFGKIYKEKRDMIQK